jgi:hypothetical protein
MAATGGIIVNSAFLTNIVLVIGLCVSIWQGVSFVTSFTSQHKELTNQVGRMETHIQRLEDKVEVLILTNAEVKLTIETVKGLHVTIRDLEKALFELTIKEKRK